MPTSPAAASATVAMPGPRDVASAPITYEEFRELAQDPATPPEDIVKYLEPDPENTHAFRPSFRLNQKLVKVEERDFERPEGAMILSSMNWLDRARRKRIFLNRIEEEPDTPILVSEGDSWFQFPFVLRDVVDQLGSSHLVWSLDAAGDTLANMVGPNAEYLDALHEVRDRHRPRPIRAFLFSGAGNDVIGEDASGTSNLFQSVKTFAPGKDARFHIDTQHYRERLAFVEAAYKMVIRATRAEFPDLPIVIHGYDHTIPALASGDPRKPWWASRNEWLGGPLDRRGVLDPALRATICKAMIDDLNEMQKRIADPALNGGFAKVFHVDVRGTLRLADFADEIHPTDDGFARVAERFRRVFAQAGI